MLDSIIIGSGPSGLEAAINLKIRGKDFIIFGKKNLSDSINKAPLINNYLGFPKIKGSELKEKFLSHLNDLNIEILEENVVCVYHMKDKCVVVTNKGEYETKTVILASGKSNVREYVNEEKFLGSGVSYCATCDGLFYKDKVVCLVGDNLESISDCNYLKNICKTVYYISKNNVDGCININSKIKELKGNFHLNEIVLDNGDTIKVDGLFIIRDQIKPSNLIPGLELEDNHVLVDKLMHTNLKGIFACGDITGQPYQYMKACGEGLIAAFEVIKYLEK